MEKHPCSPAEYTQLAADAKANRSQGSFDNVGKGPKFRPGSVVAFSNDYQKRYTVVDADAEGAGFTLLLLPLFAKDFYLRGVKVDDVRIIKEAVQRHPMKSFSTLAEAVRIKDYTTAQSIFKAIMEQKVALRLEQEQKHLTEASDDRTPISEYDDAVQMVAQNIRAAITKAKRQGTTGMSKKNLMAVTPTTGVHLNVPNPQNVYARVFDDALKLVNLGSFQVY